LIFPSICNIIAASSERAQSDSEREASQLKKHGFTLIELLVVIAVVMILAEIICSVVSRTYMKAHSLSCQSNQKALVLGFKAYTEDYDGCAMPSSSVRPDLFLMATPGLKDKTLDLLQCPSARSRESEAPIAAYSKPNSREIVSIWPSYAFNGNLLGTDLKRVSGYGKTDPARSYDQVLVFVDSNLPSGIIREVTDLCPVEGKGAAWSPDFRTGGDMEDHGVNVSFLDGSAKWFSTTGAELGMRAMYAKSIPPIILRPGQPVVERPPKPQPQPTITLKVTLPPGATIEDIKIEPEPQPAK